MSNVLEIVFRRLLQFLLLLALLPAVGAAVGYFFTPHTYQVTASLWALRRYEIIGATGTESNLQSTPAETQAIALTELLKTRMFDLSVADQAKLVTTLTPAEQADQQKRDDALFSEIANNVQVAPLQYNLFSISYASRNPVVTKQVVQAVIDNYGLQSKGFSTITGQIALDAYTTQLTKAQSDATAAAQAEQKYRQSHARLSQNDLLNDPQYVLLHAQTQQAQVTVGNIQNQIATIRQEINLVGTGTDSMYKVLDVPRVPDLPQSRMKSILSGGGAGLAIALLMIIVSVVMSLRRDHAVYRAEDLQKIAASPVIMQIPLLTARTVQLMVKQTS